MKDIMRHLQKELSKHAQDVVIGGDVSDDVQVKFANSEIVGTYTWHHESISIFANFDKRLVSTSLQELTLPAADRIIKKILSYQKSLPQTMEFNGIAKGPFSYKPLNNFDPVIAKQDPAIVQDVIDALTHAKRKGIKTTAGVMETSTHTTTILTSNGVSATEKGTTIYFTVRCFKTKDASGHHGGFSTKRNGIDFKKIVDTAASIALKAGAPKGIPAGKYDVVFAPLAIASLLMHVGNAASAFSVESGQSPFINKIGKKIANSAVTFYDDARLAGGYQSSTFDDEGRPTQKTKLIDKGILKTYLHNTSTAERFKAKPTGNAGIVYPSSTNLVLQKGTKTPEQLIKGMKKGLYITNVWYTRFRNYHTGEFSTIPRDGAFLVENGKITKAIKNIRVSENIMNILRNLAAVGNDLQPILGWEAETPCVTPHVLIKKVNITKPTK